MDNFFDIFLENFYHFISIGILPNFYYSFFEIFPEKFNFICKISLAMSEFFATLLLFYIGKLIHFSLKKFNLIEQPIRHCKMLKMPYFILLTPIFIFNIITPSFVFIVSVQRHCCDVKNILLVVFIFRLFANLFGIYIS